MLRLFQCLAKGIVLAAALPLNGCASHEADPGAASADSRMQQPDAATDAEGFSPLGLADFMPFPAGRHEWSERDGIIATTGKPKGYLYSKAPHANFTWTGEFRFIPAADPQASAGDQSNTGFMLFIQEPHKVWPRSLEVQGKQTDLGEIRPNGGVPPLSMTDDPAARDAARRPLGEWNAVEIRCRDGAVTALLNGQVVCTSEPAGLTSGTIGLQAENDQVEFRKLRIRDE